MPILCLPEAASAWRFGLPSRGRRYHDCPRTVFSTRFHALFAVCVAGAHVVVRAYRYRQGPWRHCAGGGLDAVNRRRNWPLCGSNSMSAATNFVFPDAHLQIAVLPRHCRSRLFAFSRMLGCLRLASSLGIARRALSAVWQTTCTAGHLRPI